MRVHRYFCLFVSLLLLLSGCSSGSNIPGRIDTINTAQLVEKLNQKEDFVLVFTMSDCIHCQNFKEILNEYLPDHNVVLYEVMVDVEANPEQALTELESYFPDFTGTPDLYVLEDGKIKSRFWDEYQVVGFDETNFLAWVKKYYQLDREVQ